MSYSDFDTRPAFLGGIEIKGELSFCNFILSTNKFPLITLKGEIKKVLSIVDRREAIRTAVMLAKSEDIILIAGKGHEKYQEIAGKKYPFDDKKILVDILNELDK